MNRITRPLAFVLGAFVVISAVLVVSSESSASVGYYLTFAPPAYEADYQMYNPSVGWSPLWPDDRPKVADESYLPLRSWQDGMAFAVHAENFTDTGSWIEVNDTEYYDYVGYLPPTGVTITDVSLLAICNDVNPTLMNMAFTVDDHDTVVWSETLVQVNEGLGEYRTYWDITDYYDWTPELINSTDFHAWMYLFYPYTYAYHYVDYLGLSIIWMAEGGGSGGGPSEGSSPTLSFGAEAIVPIMGLVGFIGMIAMPAMGFMAFRNNDEDRITTFVKILVAFMFCLTMFLVSISA